MLLKGNKGLKKKHEIEEILGQREYVYAGVKF